jgi:hypothetical protein
VHLRSSAKPRQNGAKERENNDLGPPRAFLLDPPKWRLPRLSHPRKRKRALSMSHRRQKSSTSAARLVIIEGDFRLPLPQTAQHSLIYERTTSRPARLRQERSFTLLGKRSSREERDRKPKPAAEPASQPMNTEKTNGESTPPAITSFSPARRGASSPRKCSPIGWPLTIVPSVLRRSRT